MRKVALFAMVIVASACSSDSRHSAAQPARSPCRSGCPRNNTPARRTTRASTCQAVSRSSRRPRPEPQTADSHAQGQAIIQIARNGDAFDYKLIVSNIDNVVQAHIHCAPEGVNGPIVVWFYPSKTSTAALIGATGRQDGVLIEDTIGPANVRTFTASAANNAACPLTTAGAPTFAEVLEKMRSGNAYVNVHTNDGVTPNNTGPGDFPGGEVRGQFKDRQE